MKQSLTEARAAKRARIARIRAEFVADFGAYYADSASQSVVDAFRSGNFVTVKA